MKHLTEFFERFRRNDRGNAAVEFALIVPFLITLYFGSLEGGAAFMADKRVNSISSTVGDLVAQWDPDNDGTLSTTGSSGTLPGYFIAATGILAPYPTMGIKMVVSLVWVNANGTTTKVIWSKSNGTATAPVTARTQGDPFAPLSIANSPQMNTTARGGCVIASEVTYSYKPLLGVVFNTTLTLSHTNYFIPRYGATNTIKVDSPTVASTSCTTGVT